jgi:hypothetical protein
METGCILSQWIARKKAARKAYHRFAGEGMAMDRIPEFTSKAVMPNYSSCRAGWVTGYSLQAAFGE